MCVHDAYREGSEGVESRARYNPPFVFCVPQKLLDGLTLNALVRIVPDDGNT